jgi:hypothetical protein
MRSATAPTVRPTMLRSRVFGCQKQKIVLGLLVLTEFVPLAKSEAVRGDSRLFDGSVHNP